MVGCDPGYTMLGLVLLTSTLTPVAWCTWHQEPIEHEMLRSVQLSVAVVDKLDQWFDKFKIERVRIGLELPVYTHNPLTFSKQWRLIQTLEDTLWGLTQYSHVELDLYEVGPTFSKHALTGNGAATKNEMVAASPFAKTAASPAIREALADAYGHAVAAGRSPVGWRLNNFRREHLAPEYEGEAS